MLFYNINNRDSFIKNHLRVIGNTPFFYHILLLSLSLWRALSDIHNDIGWMELKLPFINKVYIE